MSPGDIDVVCDEYTDYTLNATQRKIGKKRTNKK